jgi:hypothetical protein
MSSADGIVLNYFGPSQFTARTPSGGAVRILQETEYPVGGRVSISVDPAKPESFGLRVRIPGWSRKTGVTLNGKPVDGAAPGEYLVLNRQWKAGDVLDIEFGLSTRLWVGERECDGTVSVYRGPILLAYDPRFDEYDPTKLPKIMPDAKPELLPVRTPSPKPMILLRFPTTDGKGITLCDFATAGMGGNRYASLLPADGRKSAPFTRENPMRMSWP